MLPSHLADAHHQVRMLVAMSVDWYVFITVNNLSEQIVRPDRITKLNDLVGVQVVSGNETRAFR